MRVEDLQRISQNQITNNTLMYASNNGIPYSISPVDIATQVSGVTGSYVINSQLSGTSGVLQSQINNTSGYFNNNTVFVTGNQLIIGNKSISGLTKILHSPVTSGTNGLLVSYEDASNIGNNFYGVLKAYHPDVTRLGFFTSNSSGTISQAGFYFTSDNNVTMQGYQNNGAIIIDSGGNINCFGNIVANNQLNINTINDNFGNQITIDMLNGYLKAGAVTFLSWPDRQLIDGSSQESINWEARELIYLGSQVLNWQSLNLIGNWTINSIGIANVNNLQTTGQTLYKYITGISGTNSSSITNVVFQTGNQIISGNKTFATYLYSANDSQSSIDLNARTLVKNNAISINWDTKILNDSSQFTSVNWQNRFLADSSVLTALDWQNRRLYNNSNAITIDWQNRYLYNSIGTIVANWNIFNLNDDVGTVSLDWDNRKLYNNTNNNTLDWQAGLLIDNSNISSVDWLNRKLYNTDSLSSLDWHNKILSGQWTSSDIFYTPFIKTHYSDIGIQVDSGLLYDSTGPSITLDWNNKVLWKDDGTFISLDWQGQTLSGIWKADQLYISGVSVSIEGSRIFKTPKINFKTTGTYSVFTVPSNYLFNIDSMEVITTDINSPNIAPYVGFGNATSFNAYQIVTQTTSNSLNSRHIFNNPQDAISAGTIINATIQTASTATAHSGFLIFKGYLLKNQ